MMYIVVSLPNEPNRDPYISVNWPGCYGVTLFEGSWEACEAFLAARA